MKFLCVALAAARLSAPPPPPASSTTAAPVAVAQPPELPPPVVAPYSFAAHGAEWLEGMCTSRTAQSPVNFEALNIAPTKEITYNYPIVNTLHFAGQSHAITANAGSMVDAGVVVDGMKFALFYMDFHSPAEHTVRGERAPLEIQLYHKAPGTDYSVALSFLIKCATPPTEPNSASPPPPPFTEPPAVDLDFNMNLQSLVKQPLPRLGEEVDSYLNETGGWNMSALMADTLDGPATFWQYDGSMTSPPCSEAVRWYVRREPLLMSDAQIRVFDTALRNISEGRGNYRTVMPWNDRKPVVWRSKQGPLVASEDKTRLRSGPYARTDGELKAIRQAVSAKEMAMKSSEYVDDVEKRIQEAGEAHLENLQRSRKAEEEEANRLANVKRADELASHATVPPPVAKHFMPMLHKLIDDAAAKVVQSVKDVAQKAAASVTKRATSEAGRQGFQAQQMADAARQAEIAQEQARIKAAAQAAADAEGQRVAAQQAAALAAQIAAAQAAAAAAPAPTVANATNAITAAAAATATTAAAAAVATTAAAAAVATTAAATTVAR